MFLIWKMLFVPFHYYARGGSEEKKLYKIKMFNKQSMVNWTVNEMNLLQFGCLVRMNLDTFVKMTLDVIGRWEFF